ncbi:MAG: T9SS type A sorting domain-containing protein [Chitinophagaceae bacterium]
MKKILLYLIAISCITTSLKAQVQGWQWAKRSSKSNNFSGAFGSNSTIATDKVGDVYMAAVIADSNFEIDGHPSATWGKSDVLLTSFRCDGSYRWSKIIGSSNDSDRVISVKTDSLDNVYLCGAMTLKSQSGGSVNGHLDSDTTIIGNSYRTMFLAKWDSAGNFKWLRMPQPDTIGYLNANLYTSMFGMDVSPSGTVHLACYLSPGGYASYNMRVNTPGAYVIRYASDGNYLGNTALDMHDSHGYVKTWIPYFGTQFKYDPIHSRYLVYGWNYGYESFIGNSPIFQYNGFVASFNAASGTVAFQKIQTTIPNVTDTSFDIMDLALDRSGNIFITGEGQPGCVFNGMKFENTFSLKSAFIAKMDGNTGDTLWTKQGRRNQSSLYSYDFFHSGADQISVSNGVVTTGGIFIDSLNFPDYSIHNNRMLDSFDLFMVQLNASTGAINNSVIIPSGPNVRLMSVGNDERGNFYFGGYCADSIRFNSPNNPGGLAFYGANNYPYINPFWFLAKWGVPGCSCTAPNASYFAGSGSGKTVVYTYTGSTLGINSLVWDWGDGQSTTISSGFATAVNHTYATTGKQYIVCVNVYGDCGSNQYCGLSAPVSVAMASHTASGILLYPNPANDYLILENASGAQVEMYNTLGQKIRSFNVGQARERVDVGELTKGVYLLQFNTKDGGREQISWIKQ